MKTKHCIRLALLIVTFCFGFFISSAIRMNFDSSKRSNGESHVQAMYKKLDTTIDKMNVHSAEKSNTLIASNCPSQTFENHPELKANQVNVYTMDDFVKYIDKQDLLLQKTECVRYKVHNVSIPLVICIYDVKIDRYVSGSIKNSGSWEFQLVKNMLRFMDRDPDMMLVDIGSNLGVFTLAAAAKGHDVLSVDALVSNHHQLRRTLLKNNLHCKVTQIHGALDGKRGEMDIEVIMSNIGGSFLKNVSDQRTKESIRYRVNTIRMDDLMPLVRGRNIFIKMDIETFEDEALSCSHSFFQESNIKALQIEWNGHRARNGSGDYIRKLLKDRGFSPYRSLDKSQIGSDPSKWPGDVYFLRN